MRTFERCSIVLEGEWVRVPALELAIVSDPEWAAAHAQMDCQRARYSPARKSGAAPWSIEARYLLTGLLRCAVCGAGLDARSRAHGRRRVVFYGGSAYHRRGCSVCRNALTAPMTVADAAIIRALETSVLNPQVLRAAVDRMVDRVCRRAGTRFLRVAGS